MSIITLPDLKAHLRLDADDTAEDTLLQAKLDAAEAWVGSYIGEPVANYGTPCPPPLAEAIRQLAAHLYEEREGYGDGVPADTLRLIQPFRDWSF